MGIRGGSRLFGRYDVSSICFSIALLFLFAFVMPHNLLEFAVGILGGWAYLCGLFRWVILSLRTVTLLEVRRWRHRAPSLGHIHDTAFYTGTLDSDDFTTAVV
jgi:hypothetical protein